MPFKYILPNASSFSSNPPRLTRLLSPTYCFLVIATTAVCAICTNRSSLIGDASSNSRVVRTSKSQNSRTNQDAAELAAIPFRRT